MFKGYLSLGGTELVNASRVEAYIRNNAPGIPLKNCYDCGSLAEALEEGVYDSPLVDNAPWIDPNSEATNRFYGVYPLDIQGMEDSTRGATVTQSIIDGGSVGSVRLATRSIRVRGLMLAADEAAMSAGMTWLRNALNPALCESHGGSCGGAQLCYYAACPVITDCWEPTYQAGFGMPIYAETPATSPVIFRETVIQNSIWRATLHVDDDVQEGLIIRWGAVSSTDSDEWVQQRGPIVMRRINYVPIPNMEGLLTPVFDFWDWDNEGSLAIVTMPDGTRALNYYGGAPGPELTYSWVGAANNSMSEARLVSDSSLAYTNRFPNPAYMPAFAGPVTTIRTSYVANGVPGALWDPLGVDGSYSIEPSGGPVIDGYDLNWAKLEWAGAPASVIAGFSTNDPGIVADAISGSTEYTISMYGIASGPIAAEIRATWYNGAASVGVTTHPVTHSQAETWKRDNFTITSPPTATRVRVEYRFLAVDTSLPLGGWIGATGLLIEQGNVLRKYFDGNMPDPAPFDDVLYAFSGGVRSIMTMRTIPHMPNAPGLGNAVGAYSIDSQAAVVVPLGTGSDDTYITYGPETGMQLGMVAGGHYAARATFAQFEGPQTGAINENARSIVVMVDGAVFARSPQPGNINGETFELQVDFIIPADATDVSVRYYHGAETEVVYWWDTSVIEIGPSGTYPYRGPAFDGDWGDSYSTNRSGDMAMTNAGVVVSFDAQAEETYGSDLRVRLRSSDDDEILAEALFELPPAPLYDPSGPEQEWVRYSFTAPSTEGTAYLEFVRGGGALITRVMIERGFTPLPYFDGSTPIDEAMAGYRTEDIPAEVEYDIYWHGEIDRSASQINYALEPTFGGSPIPDIWNSTTDGLCFAVPRIDIAQGTLKGTFGVGLRLPIQPERQVRHLERTLHEVTAVEGPFIIAERTLGNGAVMREVDWVMVAGRPSPYGPTDQIMDQRMSDLDTTPWVDPDCTVEEEVAILDPDCPPVPAPPRPPSIPNSCITDEVAWQRYWLPIDKEWVSSWATTAPQVTITSGVSEIRQVRFRVYPNPFQREIETATMANRATNPTLEVNVTGWANLNGVGTATGRMSLGGDGPVFGIDTWYRATASGAHGVGSFGPISFGATENLVAPGEKVFPTIWARASIARTLRIRYIFLDEADLPIGGTILGPSTAVAANTWIRLQPTGSSIAPAGTVRMSVAVIDSSAVMAAGQTIDVTGLNLMTTTDDVVGPLVGTYFDGNTENADGWYYGWTGAVGNSSSLAMRSGVDPCSYCSEFIVSYMPSQTTLTVDSILERAFASVAGSPAVPASHLLYAGDGGPMTWSELTCGMDYLIAIDVPEPLLDDVRVRVTLTNKE